MIRMQTPDGWMTVAGPRNMRAGAASCLQSLTSLRKASDLPGLVIGNSLLERAGGAKKGEYVCLKICGPLESFKDLNREKYNVFCVDLW